MSSVAELKSIIANETLAASTRRAAADHLIEVLLADVQPPAPDHPEVLKLREGWRRETENDRWLADTWAKTCPKEVNGFPLQEAINIVYKRLQFRALTFVVVDTDSQELERLAACATLLEKHLHEQGFHRRNGYTPNRLLAEVKPETATKWTSLGKVPVERPPKQLADCW